MSAFTAAMIGRLLALACALVAAVSAETEGAGGGGNNQTKREVAGPFLTDIIKRIDSDRRQVAVARPVEDLQVALDRIAEIFGPEAANLEDAPTFELPENADAEPLSASSTSVENAVFPTAASATATSGPPSVNGISAALTPQELQALYQIAVNKGLNLDLSAIQGGVLPAPAGAPAGAGPQGSKAGSSAIAGPTPVPATSTGSTAEPAEGYYYYFVPLKNLNGPLQQQASQALMNQANSQQNPESHGAGAGMESSAANHAADAAAAAALMAGGADRAVEPLFMAMAGFVGMALMFVASVLFLPKLGALRSLKHAPDEVASIGKLVLQSIEGKDCSERLTCEIGRAARSLKLGGKPLRVLELCLPPPMAVQISRIRRAAARKEKCNFIPCKFRRPPKLELPPKKPWVKPPFRPSLFKPIAKPPNRPVREESPYKPPPTPASIFGTPQTDYPEYPDPYHEGKWSTPRPHPPPRPHPTTSRPPTSPRTPTSTRGPAPPRHSTPRTPTSTRAPQPPKPPTSPRPQQHKKGPKAAQPQSREPRSRR